MRIGASLPVGVAALCAAVGAWQVPGGQSTAPRPGRRATETRVHRVVRPSWFEPNMGQAAAGTEFVARTPGYTAALAGGGAAFALRLPSTDGDGSPGRGGMPEVAISRMRFAGVRPDLGLEAEEPLAGKVNCFLGNDPAKHRTGIPTSAALRGREAWPGVDLVWRAGPTGLEYRFEVAPGADAGAIGLKFPGWSARVTEDGALEVAAPGGTLRHGAPVAWEETASGRRSVAVSFAERPDGTCGFSVGARDDRGPLVIDPTVTWSGYLGGQARDSCSTGAVTSTGDIVFIGYAESADFPVTKGAYDESPNGIVDVFVTRIGPGGLLQFCTLVGGSDMEFGDAVALGKDESVYVGGSTYSSDCPQVDGKQAYADSGDGWVFHLSADGSRLLYSTLFGGIFWDNVVGLGVSGDGLIHIVGTYQSPGLPTTPDAVQTENPYYTCYKAYYAVLNETPDPPVYATYMGGDGYDWGNGLGFDLDGGVLVWGQTGSSTFPLLHSLRDRTAGGPSDGFLAKFAPDHSLVFSTLVGGSGEDGVGSALATGPGDYFVVGNTSSTDLPLVDPIQATPGGATDMLLGRLAFDGATITQEYSSYLGGALDDYGWNAYADGEGGVFLACGVSSEGLPTPGGFQTTFGGGSDEYIARLSPDGKEILYGTYWGGSGSDWGSVCIGKDGEIYLLGTTESAGLPSNPPEGSPFHADLAGPYGPFVARIDFLGFASPFPAAATVGRPFAAVLAGRGGTAPYAFSVVEGALPVTGDLSSAGVIDGAWTGSGDQAFKVRVIDALGETFDRSVSVRVNPLPGLASPGPLYAAVGRPFATTLEVAGGTGALTRGLTGTLPSWLALDLQTGVLQGTPPEGGRVGIPLTVTDATGAESADAPLVLRVAEVPDLGRSVKSGKVREFPAAVGLEAVRGSTLAVKAKFQGGTASADALVLRDNTGRALPVSGQKSVKGATVSWTGVEIPQTGRYFLAVEPGAEFAGSVTVTVKVAAPRLWEGSGDVDVGVALRVEIAAPANGKLTFEAWAAEGSEIDPVILSVQDGDGNDLLGAQVPEEKDRYVRLRLANPVPGGEIVILLGSKDGAFGWGTVEWKATVKGKGGCPLPELTAGSGL